MAKVTTRLQPVYNKVTTTVKCSKCNKIIVCMKNDILFVCSKCLELECPADVVKTLCEDCGGLK